MKRNRKIHRWAITNEDDWYLLVKDTKSEVINSFMGGWRLTWRQAKKKYGCRCVKVTIVEGWIEPEKSHAN